MEVCRIVRAAMARIVMIAFALLCLAQPSWAQDAAWFEAMRAADLRLASTGFRLSTAAAPLCDRIEPGLGLQLHGLSQYDGTARELARAHFALTTPIGVEGVVPGSPAARASLAPNDSIVSIAGIAPPADIAETASTQPLAAFLSRVASLPADRPIEIVAMRGGRRIAVTVMPVPACRTRYELRIADRFDARANGELVQISSRYLEALAPELLPAAVAHELAHNILRHRERLAAAGAEFGLASGFGRNVGLFRQTEIEADILSVHLLARAGYPPRLAGRFWREAGPKIMAGMIRSRSHPALEDRIATVEAEAARFAAPGAVPPPPTFFEHRDRPLDGNWRPLLVRPR
jgi:hypothetical protein